MMRDATRSCCEWFRNKQTAVCHCLRRRLRRRCCAKKRRWPVRALPNVKIDCNAFNIESTDSVSPVFTCTFQLWGGERQVEPVATRAAAVRWIVPKKSKPSRSRISAGLLMFRRKNDEIEVLLAHPGGPFFVGKDDGVWTIPKGEAAPGEDLLTRAQIEFEEELGFRPENVQKWIEL